MPFGLRTRVGPVNHVLDGVPDFPMGRAVLRSMAPQSHCIPLSPYVDKPLKSVTHSQCDTRPTVTFPAIGHHCPLTSTNLYCLVTEARVWTTCLRLLPETRMAGSWTTMRDTLSRESNIVTIMPPVHKHVVALSNLISYIPLQLRLGLKSYPANSLTLHFMRILSYGAKHWTAKNSDSNRTVSCWSKILWLVQCTVIKKTWIKVKVTQEFFAYVKVKSILQKSYLCKVK